MYKEDPQKEELRALTKIRAQEYEREAIPDWAYDIMGSISEMSSAINNLVEVLKRKSHE